MTTTTVAVAVTVDNFIRAESDVYMAGLVERSGVGRFDHRRQLTEIDKQDVIRMNRDTLYSSAVFDLDAGPVTITLPDAGERFMSLQLINQDHHVPAVHYGAGRYTIDRQGAGTRYVLAALRTLVDPNDPRDLEQVHALQDAVEVELRGVGKFAVPDWDPVSQKKVRDALLVLASTKSGLSGFGRRGEVDPVAHLLSTAAGWGGNPPQDAVYVSAAPARNDGTTVHRLTVGDVPVDAFWSISVYNAAGFFERNARGAYSVNDITAKKDADGSVTVQFGGCDGEVPNCLPIVKGWNYTVRLYRPRAEILSRKWRFPEAQPVG